MRAVLLRTFAKCSLARDVGRDTASQKLLRQHIEADASQNLPSGGAHGPAAPGPEECIEGL